MSNPAILAAEVELAGKIPAVPTILEVICRTTGMGFAAVARVTGDRWIACSVLDNINFGLKPGAELEVDSTICHEVRQSRESVVIENVSQDAHWSAHHTPLKYGFQSYISVPIVLADDSFFGTLCAIDPHPASLDSVEVIGMFRLFADLIGKHIDTNNQLYILRKLTKQLSQSNDDLQQFAHAAAHDLKSPLRSIINLSEFVQRQLGPERAEKVDEPLSEIVASGKRLAELIDSLLLYAAVAGEPLAPEFGSPREACDIAVGNLRHAVEESRADITVDIPEDAMVALSLPHLLQLFQNLIGNALQYRQDQVAPKILVRMVPSAAGTQFVDLTVEDNGVGIPESQAGVIFEPFKRLHGRERPGSGLGLATCKRIVERAKGAIRVERSPTGGSVFYCTLPG